MDAVVLAWIAGEVLVAILVVRAILVGLSYALGLATITRKSMLAGGLYGSLAGVVLGPVSVIALMMVLHSLYGTRFLGIEVLAGPVLGAVVFAIPGALAGAFRGILAGRREDAKAGVSEASGGVRRNWEN